VFRLRPYRCHLCWRPPCRARERPANPGSARNCCRCERVGVRKDHPHQLRWTGSRRHSFSFDNSPRRGVGKIVNPPRNPRPLTPKRTEGNGCTPHKACAPCCAQVCGTATDLQRSAHPAPEARAGRCNGSQIARNPPSLWMRARRFASRSVGLRYSFAECHTQAAQKNPAKLTGRGNHRGRRIPERLPCPSSRQ